jgi:hypothetical protein
MTDLVQQLRNVTVGDWGLTVDKLIPVATDLRLEVGTHDFTFNDRLKRFIALSEWLCTVAFDTPSNSATSDIDQS